MPRARSGRRSCNGVARQSFRRLHLRRGRGSLRGCAARAPSRHPRRMRDLRGVRAWKDFDNIVLGHVLEHVERPVEILSRVKSWLSANGRVFALVPNARSLHRQMGVVMGLLDSEHSLNAVICITGIVASTTLNRCGGTSTCGISNRGFRRVLDQACREQPVRGELVAGNDRGGDGRG